MNQQTTNNTVTTGNDEAVNAELLVSQPPNVVFNDDCMNIMAQYSDKFFELAVVDSPYGVGDFQQSDGNYKPVIWNNEIPSGNYFQELLRVSKHQIVWGANYYNCFSATGGAIVWDKLNVHPSMSRCEIASCSMQKRITYFNYEWHGYVVKRIEPGSFHPCQKPVALYDWIFMNYAKKGDKILDTHLGSGSSRIAAWKAGLEFYGCELDKDYYEKQEDRFKKFVSQLTLF